MDWRWFLPLPIAAFLCGDPVDAPRLRTALPVDSVCPNYAAAREDYLRAYAYAREDRGHAQSLASRAHASLKSCHDEATRLLADRIGSLIEGLR